MPHPKFQSTSTAEAHRPRSPTEQVVGKRLRQEHAKIAGNESILGNLNFDPNTRVPMKKRQRCASSLEAVMAAKGIEKTDLLKQAALALERHIHDTSSSDTYQTVATNILLSLRRKSNIGGPFTTASALVSKLMEEHEGKNGTNNRYEAISHIVDRFVLSKSLLRQLDYPMAEIQETESVDSSDSLERICDRCGKYFMLPGPIDKKQCVYHWGKSKAQRIDGERCCMYTCCNQGKFLVSQNLLL